MADFNYDEDPIFGASGMNSGNGTADSNMSMEDIDKLFDDDELNKLLHGQNDSMDDYMNSAEIQNILNADNIDDIIGAYQDTAPSQTQDMSFQAPSYTAAPDPYTQPDSLPQDGGFGVSSYSPTDQMQELNPSFGQGMSFGQPVQEPNGYDASFQQERPMYQSDSYQEPMAPQAPAYEAPSYETPFQPQQGMPYQEPAAPENTSGWFQPDAVSQTSEMGPQNTADMGMNMPFQPSPDLDEPAGPEEPGMKFTPSGSLMEEPLPQDNFYEPVHDTEMFGGDEDITIAEKPHSKLEPPTKELSSLESAPLAIEQMENIPGTQQATTVRGGRADSIAEEQPKKKKSHVGLGVFVTLLAVFGVVALVVFGSGMVKKMLNKTDEKKEWASLVYPMVVIDIPEFTDVSRLDSKQVVFAAVWELYRNETDKDKYQVDDYGYMTVPQSEIESYVRKIFGTKAKVKHQTINDLQFDIQYDSESKTYLVPSNLTAPYVPRVKDIKHKGDVYTITVEYIEAKGNIYEEEALEKADVTKTMIFTYTKDKDKYTVQKLQKDKNAPNKEKDTSSKPSEDTSSEEIINEPEVEPPTPEGEGEGGEAVPEATEPPAA